MKESLAQIKTRVKKIIARLKKDYPDSKCSLNFKTPHQLLVATILSAQCTDERVNIVTKDLFKKYKKPEDYLNVETSELESDIHSTGFFRNKAKSIRGSAQMLTELHNGKMPDSLAQLVKLPGVGRKTGSVVLGVAFNKAEGIVVDTHVGRITQLLKLTKEKDPVKTEKDLMAVIPQNDWIIISHLLIDHGRKVCKARKPDCGNCGLSKLCPSVKNN